MVVTRIKDGGEQTYLYLPDTMSDWPWPRRINPRYEEVTAESNAWFASFKPFTPVSQYAFDKGDFGRVASLAYPEVSPEALRVGIDLMNLFFIIDEYTDVESAPVVREIVGIVTDALHDPRKLRPKGEVVLGEMTRQFWARAQSNATPQALKHFIKSFTEYLDSVVIQAGDRDNNSIRTIDSYLEMRRENAGARPSIFPAELHLSIPDEVYDHPVIRELEYLSAELIVLDNDIVSYNKEQATGNDMHNILTIFMHSYHSDFDSAMSWVADYHKDVQLRFLDALSRVPSWGPQVDSQVSLYINILGNWPRANHCWSFESGRYFGSKGLEYEKTRLVPLLPKRPRNPNLRREQVEVPLVEEIGQ